MRYKHLDVLNLPLGMSNGERSKQLSKITVRKGA